MSVRKGSTFHSPISPPSPSHDPILNIKSLPLRSLTSPEALQDLCDESEKRVADLLVSFNRNLSGLGSTIETDHEHQESLPISKSLAANVSTKSTLMDASAPSNNNNNNSGQAADGSKHVDRRMSPPSSIMPTYANTVPEAKYSTYTPHKRSEDVNDKDLDAQAGHALSDYAAKVIKLHIIDPIKKEEDLSAFHPLVDGLPQRIGSKQITCLRDLEKTLIFLAPVSTNLSAGEGVLAHCFLNAKTKARSPLSYWAFCEFSIQCIHTTVNHLNEIDLRRPTDRPYTNNYFVDLVDQVRAYARIMARSRAKKAKGQPLDDSDIQPSVPTVTYESSSGDLVLTLHSRGEKIALRGGLGEDGKPAELVRERDGSVVAIDEGHYADEEMFDTDVLRSMARKRKCDIGKVEYHACRECGKVYTRPCDLTKHEKTHSRPWKCNDETCKYYELGWPTEKERDRHVNDKHSNKPALYRCLFRPCAYTSKRESNCKQHMEKAHGWDYIRSKSRKGTKLVPTRESPATQLMPTPGSEHVSTPASTNNQSPNTSSYSDFSRVASLDSGFGSSRASVSSSHHTHAFAPSPASNGAFDFNEYGKDSYSYNNGYISPSLSENPRRLSDNNMSHPNNGMNANFEETFNWDSLNYEWGPMGNVFTGYQVPSSQQQPQQPTPASDMAFDFDLYNPSGTAQPELSPNGQGDSTLFGDHTDAQMESQGFVDFASHGHAQTKAGAQQQNSDFTLFGEIPSSTTHNNNSGAMFPDLNGGMSIGLDAGEFSGHLGPDGTVDPGDVDMGMGMFGDMSEEEMDRYLYGDGGNGSTTSPGGSSGDGF